MAAFWNELYERRNSAVHAGVIPAENDVLAAEEAFDGLKTFLEQRLMAKWKTFPRALMCLLGEDLRGAKLAAKPAFLSLQETVLADEFYWVTPGRRTGVDPSLRTGSASRDDTRPPPGARQSRHAVARSLIGRRLSLL